MLSFIPVLSVPSRQSALLSNSEPGALTGEVASGANTGPSLQGSQGSQDPTRGEFQDALSTALGDLVTGSNGSAPEPYVTNTSQAAGQGTPPSQQSSSSQQASLSPQLAAPQLRQSTMPVTSERLATRWLSQYNLAASEQPAEVPQPPAGNGPNASQASASADSSESTAMSIGQMNDGQPLSITQVPEVSQFLTATGNLITGTVTSQSAGVNLSDAQIPTGFLHRKEPVNTQGNTAQTNLTTTTLATESQWLLNPSIENVPPSNLDSSQADVPVPQNGQSVTLDSRQDQQSANILYLQQPSSTVAAQSSGSLHSSASVASDPTSVTASDTSSAQETLAFALLLHPKVISQTPVISNPSISAANLIRDARADLRSSGSSVSSTPAATMVTSDSTGKNDPSVEQVSTEPQGPITPTQLVASTSAKAADPTTNPQGQSVAVANSPASSLRDNTQSSSSDSSTVVAPQQATKTNIATLDGGTPNAMPSNLAMANAVPGNVVATPTTPTTARAAETTPSTTTLPQAAQAQPQAAKEVVLRLQGESGESINVRLVDQGNHVQVAVRSSDPATANLIRQDLSSLTSNLDRAGWRPETLPSAQSLTMSARETSQGSNPNDQNQRQQAAPDWDQQSGGRKPTTVADLWDEILNQGT